MAILIHFVDPKESDDDAVPPELRCLGALRHGHRCLVHRYRCSLQRCDFCVMASILAWCSGLGGHLGIAPWEKRLGLIPLWWNCMNAWVSGKIEKRQIEHDWIHCLACSWLFNYCRPILHQCDFDQSCCTFLFELVTFMASCLAVAKLFVLGIPDYFTDEPFSWGSYGKLDDKDWLCWLSADAFCKYHLSPTATCSNHPNFDRFGQGSFNLLPILGDQIMQIW